MTRTLGVGVVYLSAAVFVISPSLAWAQRSSGIAGVARDTSGAVLPGVTVEASSPALIERTRSVTTDGEGRYSLEDLRPGRYQVTFSLSGFKTLKREGIDIPVGFTATVSVEMALGELSETITVSGAAPLVDTQNTAQQKVLNAETMSALPTGSKTLMSFVSLTPGLTGAPVVGGAVGLYASSGNIGGIHGKTGNKQEFDGLPIINTNFTIGHVSYIINPSSIQETSLETGGSTAESSVSATATNSIPRDGGNRWSGTAFFTGTGQALQSDNLTDDLKARQLTTSTKLMKNYDVNLGFGGPLKRDSLWFFSAARYSNNYNQWAGTFWNKTQGTPFYTPDLSAPGYRHEFVRDVDLRLTWQASPKNKIATFLSPQRYVVYGSTSSLANAPETVAGWYFKPQGLYQATWTNTASNRLFFQGGTSFMFSNWRYFATHNNTFDQVAITDVGSGFSYGAPPMFYYDATNRSDRWSQAFSASYVTGTHTLKAGVQIEEGLNDVGNSVDHKMGFTGQTIPGNVAFTFRNGVPISLTQYATPFTGANRISPDMGIFVQDRWTISRLTLNLGVRFDYLRSRVPVQDIPASPFVPARHYEAVECIPCWKDINPRFGAAYDLKGDGKTALKFSLGRYTGKHGAELAYANNPLVTSVNSVNRPWTDANKDYFPNCDLTNPLSNGECGPINNTNFGSPTVVTRWSDDLRQGWFKRDYWWDLAAEVQRQLGAGVSVSAGYYYNRQANFRDTDNLRVTPDDYSPYNVVAPRDPRLPGGGGYTIAGLYDISPAKYNQTQNVVILSPGHTRRSKYFDGSISLRLGEMRLGGGVDIGQDVDDNCVVIDSPEALRDCHQATLWRQGTQIKINGSYPLPHGFVVSAVFQNIPGANLYSPNLASTTANTVRSFSNADVQPALGRPLASCGNPAPATCTQAVTVRIINPDTIGMYEPRLTQLDLRGTKLLKVGQGMRLRLNADLYNVFNNAAVLTQQLTYGPLWRKPSQVLDGRLLQFSAQIDF